MKKRNKKQERNGGCEGRGKGRKGRGNGHKFAEDKQAIKT